MIRVKLNDAISVDVDGTDDPQIAAQQARAYFRQNHPQEFEAWRRTQLGLGSSISRSASAGIDQFQSTLYSAAEGLGRATGDRNLERFGRAGRVEQQSQAETAFPSELRQSFTDVEDVGGGARAAAEAIAGSLPSTAAGITGALAGARAGAAGGLRGRVVGGILGGAGVSFPQLFGSNIERQIEESGDIVSPGAAAAAAAVQAPLESAADVATLGAARILRRPATEAVQAVGAGLGRRLATGAAVGGATEVPVEIAQTALERAQAGLPLTGPEATREYTEAGLGGLAGGAFTGGALGGAFGQRPAPAAVTPPSPPSAAEGAAPVAGAPIPGPAAAAAPAPQEPYFTRTPIPQSPELLRSSEQAEAFVTANPDNYTPPSALPTPEARLAWVNSKRQADYQQEVQNLRENAISNFAATQPDTFFNNLAQAAAEGNLKSLNRFSANDVANAALRSSGIEPGRLTKDERKFVNEQLNILANEGILAKPTATSFSVSFDPRPPIVEQTPQTEFTQRERETALRDVADFNAAYEAGTLDRVSPFEARRRFALKTPPRPQPTPAPEVAPATDAVPPTTQEAPVPQAAPAPPAPQAPAGFKTALGSTYAINDQGQTIRTKQSPGRGQGKTYEPHNALFVTPDEANNVLEELRGGNTYRFIVNDPAGPRRTEPGESLQGKQVALGIFRPDGSIVRYVPAQMRPAVGLSPVELRVEGTGADRKSFRHIGNPITELAGAPATTGRVPSIAPQPIEAQRPAASVPATGEPRTLAQAEAVVPPTPEARQLGNAVAQAYPGTDAGSPTSNFEEALFSSPQTTTIQQQQKLLDTQIADGFRPGFWRMWLASPITGLGRQPQFAAFSNVSDRMFVRKQSSVTYFNNQYQALGTLPPESQARAMLALQDSRSRQQMWDRNAFTAEENAAMDATRAMGQRGLDYLVDSFTTDYFNPADAKTDADRARLQAFQREKGDRLITDMPPEQVRDASPEGFAEVQRLNSIRDPFFFPQVARGSHFVAAYEQQPNGKEKLVRIYFYNPVEGIQKARQRIGIQRDFEAISIKALRDEFPDTGRYRIMTRGMRAENNERARNLKRDGEFITRYLEKLSEVSGPEAKKIINQMSKEIDKAQMDRFFRPNNDILRAVTPENAVDYARDTLPNYYLTLANIQSRRHVEKDFNRAIARLSFEEKNYANDYFNYNTTPTESFGTGRALAFFWYLGFNFSTAAIQFTQNLVLAARLLRDGAGLNAARFYATAARDVYLSRDLAKSIQGELNFAQAVAKAGNLPADEVAALQRAIQDGRLRPSQTASLQSQVSAESLRNAGIADKSATAFAAGANKMLDWSGRMLNAVDETNRVAAFLAAYRLAKAQPSVMQRAARMDNRTYANPYEYAQATTDETNFRGGPEDRPLIQRFHPAAEIVTQFQGPVFKLLELYARSAAQTVEGIRKSDPVMAKAAAIQFLALLAPQVAIAGIWSLPFADRLKELMEFIWKTAFGEALDFEQELEKYISNGLVASAANYGLPHAYGAMTLTSRMKIDPLPQGSITDWDVFSLLGPIGGLIQKPLEAHQAWQLGDYWGISYALAPTSLANVIKGGQIELTGEQYTRRGGRIITPQDVERAAESGFLPPSLQQAVGFAPPEFGDIRRTVNRQRELQQATRDPTERANIELSRIVMRMYEAQQAGRRDEVAARRQELATRVREIRAEQEGKAPEFQVQINPTAILDRARKDFLGRGSPEVLTRATREPARAAAVEMVNRSLWRNQ